MDDFAAKPGAANMFGLVQGEANAIAPGKRPLSSMTPTIILEDSKLRYVLGSPGGGRIISTVGNIFLSAAEGRHNIQEAVDAPRFHHQYRPDILYLEPGPLRSPHCGRWATRSRSAAAIRPTASASPSIPPPESCSAARTTGATSARPRDIDSVCGIECNDRPNESRQTSSTPEQCAKPKC
jgi:hypothetical protein